MCLLTHPQTVTRVSVILNGTSACKRPFSAMKMLETGKNEKINSKGTKMDVIPRLSDYSIPRVRSFCGAVAKSDLGPRRT